MSTFKIKETSAKTYAIFAQEDKYYLYTYQNNGEHQKVIQLYSVPANKNEWTPIAFNLDTAISIKKIFSDIAPIDVRVFLDGVEIHDNEQKSSIVDSLTIFEHKNISQITMTALSERTLKAAKEEQALRTQVNVMLQSVQNNLGGFNGTKFKKLQSSLQELLQ